MASSTVTNAKYLDYAGLSTLVGNIKTLVDNKIIAAKQVLGGRLGKGLTATEVQIGLHTPSGFTVSGSDATELSSISIPGATTSNAGVMTAADKTKLTNIEAGAQVNQNAFYYVDANGTQLTPTTATDTLTIKAGSGISITPSSNGRAFSIANTYKYTHPDYATTTTSSTSALSSGSKFTTLTGLEYHDDGHLKTIISKEFTLPKLIDNISFASSSTTTSTANSVNVVQSFTNITKIAGTHQVNVKYGLVEVPTKVYVDSAIADKIATADALIYKGTKTPDSNGKIFLETDAKCGYLYKAAAAGYVYVTGTTTQGQHVEAGDMIIANTDSPTTLAGWDIIERNIDGAVSGPASSTDGYVAVFNGTTGKIIKQGVALTGLATSGHKHIISANGTNGDTEITVGRSSGELAVTYNISHNAKLGKDFESKAAGATADAWGESVTVKVPKLNINTYGHVTSASEVDYTIAIPTPTHETLQLETYWGDTADSKDSYNTGTARTWKIYKGVKSIDAGSNITVTPSGGVVKIANTYKYTLPLAANGTRGGIQIGFTTSTANKNYAVQLSSEQAYVNVPWENDKVQSTTVSGGTHYLLGSDNKANETDYAYKRDNVYISDDEVLACAPSTVKTSTASKVITHSDAITVAMINALFT